MQLERRLGVVLANDDTILAWIPTFSGDVISRCRRGETLWEREVGGKLSRQSLECGERVFVREAREKSTERHMIGHHDSLKSGTRATMREPIIGLTSAGVRVGSCPKRVPEDTRWSTDGWLELQDLPWELLADAAVPALALPRPDFLQGQALRTFYVLKPDIKHAATFGCKLCSFVSRGAKSSVRHSDEAGRESWRKEECGRSWTRML